MPSNTKVAVFCLYRRVEPIRLLLCPFYPVRFFFCLWAILDRSDIRTDFTRYIIVLCFVDQRICAFNLCVISFSFFRSSLRSLSPLSFSFFFFKSLLFYNICSQVYFEHNVAQFVFQHIAFSVSKCFAIIYGYA